MSRLTDLAKCVGPVFGVSRLDLDLERSDVRRFVAASFLPLVLIAFVLVELVVEMTDPEVTTYPAQGWADWSGRILAASHYVIQYGTPVAAAWLFAVASATNDRRLSSSAAVAAVVLLLISLASGAFVVFVFFDTYSPYLTVRRHYAQIWEDLAQASGFLAIGYAFLAYRGLSVRNGVRRAYGRRRRSAAS